MHYNFHRYYDPKIGRYLRIDPIGFNGGDMNLYEYAESSPNNAFDRYGLTTDYYIPIHPRLGSLLGTKKDIVDLETMKSHLDPFGAGLVFTCRCGWLDLGHIRHAMDRVLQWYLEIQMYSTMGSTLRGLEIDYTLERDYAPAEFIEFATMLAYKESVIHEYVSLGLQPNSAYSPEDLPSNHIGIMIAGNHVADFVPRPTVEEWVNAMDTDLKKVLEECVILSKEKSENVWEEYVKGEDKWFTPGGWIGGGTLHRRNPSHEPWIIACEECEHVEDKSYPSWFSEPYWGPIPEPWLPEP